MSVYVVKFNVSFLKHTHFRCTKICEFFNKFRIVTHFLETWGYIINDLSHILLVEYAMHEVNVQCLLDSCLWLPPQM